jgi:hypothetical protein
VVFICVYYLYIYVPYIFIFIVVFVDQAGPIQELHLSDPVKKRDFDFDRSAYIIYDSAAAAMEALPKLQNSLVEDPELSTPFRLTVVDNDDDICPVSSRFSQDVHGCKKL